jgi:hypothetical protein
VKSASRISLGLRDSFEKAHYKLIAAE